MGQQAVPSGPAPQGASEEALRARVSQFYQDFVDGKFRAADAFVADDSKDAFFAEEKIRYKSCSVGKLTIAADGKTAIAVTSCATTWAFHGQRIPTTIPMTSNWKLQNGDWFWYSVPFDGNVNTPFGKMKVDPDGQHQSAIPADPGAMVPGMLSGVRASKTAVSFAPDKPAHEEVEITNGMPGPVRLSLIQPGMPGLKIQLSSPLLGTKQKAVLSFDYVPVTGSAPRSTSVTVQVAPLQQVIPIRINFAAASAGKTTAQK